MIEYLERGLTPHERAELEDRLTYLQAVPRSTLVRTGIAAVVVCGVLSLFTLAASNAPRPIILVFWLVMAAVLTAWIVGTSGRDARMQASALREALAHNRAKAVRIQSSRVVEFEEIEDEGACYAFGVGDGRIVFIQGQEFYADEGFPSDDFSIVEVLGASGAAVDVLIMKDGRRIQPQRLIDAATKNRLQIPDHLQVIEGDLARVEELLPHTTRR